MLGKYKISIIGGVMITYEFIQTYFIYFILFGLLGYIVQLVFERFNIWKTGATVVLWIVFLVYIMGLLYITLLGRTPGTSYDYELTLFWSYAKALKPESQYLWREILGNIVAFFPLGIFIKQFLGKKSRWYICFLVGLFVSGGIESIQLFDKLGLFEFDDIINNVCGAMIGYAVAVGLRCIIISNKKKHSGNNS